MTIRGIKVETYNLPVDTSNKESRVRHLVDFENMEKTIDSLQNKQGRGITHGQSTTETV